MARHSFRSFRIALSVLGLFVPPLLMSAQTARGTQPEDFGSVTGHVICSDTQHPARLAQVRLVPVALPEPAKEGGGGWESSGGVGSGLAPIETDMSGSFTVRHVRAGQYYLRVDYPGYITPLLGFSRSQLTKPSVADQQRMAQELQMVTVAPNAATQAEVTVARGSAISGTVTYDDGSPAINVPVLVFRRNAKGEFKDKVMSATFTPPTDDHGRYRTNYLPPDDYVVEADLSMSAHTMSSMPNPGGGEIEFSMSTTLFDLPIYSGSVLRRRDAALVKAAAGQETPNVDLTIPLSKLHPVTGSLLAKDGHTVNGGKVELLHSDDREELASVKIDQEDKQFHFPYVPEDDYILSAPDPKDTTEVEVENAKGVMPRTHTESKTVRTYGAAEQSVKVQTDISGLIVNVPDKSNRTGNSE